MSNQDEGIESNAIEQNKEPETPTQSLKKYQKHIEEYYPLNEKEKEQHLVDHMIYLFKYVRTSEKEILDLSDDYYMMKLDPSHYRKEMFYSTVSKDERLNIEKNCEVYLNTLESEMSNTPALTGILERYHIDIALIFYRMAELENYRGMRFSLLGDEEAANRHFQIAKYYSKNAIKKYYNDRNSYSEKWYMYLSLAKSLFGLNEKEKAITLVLKTNYLYSKMPSNASNKISPSQQLLSSMLSEAYLLNSPESRKSVFLSYNYEPASIRKRTATIDMLHDLEAIGLSIAEIKEKGYYSFPLIEALDKVNKQGGTVTISFTEMIIDLYRINSILNSQQKSTNNYIETIEKMRTFVAHFISFEKDGNKYEKISDKDKLLIAYRSKPITTIFSDIDYFVGKSTNEKDILSDYLKHRNFYVSIFLREIYASLKVTCKDQIEVLKNDPDAFFELSI